MASYMQVLDVDDDDRGQQGVVDPSAWPTVRNTMCGFDFPQLAPCRALRVGRSAAGGEEDPDLLMLEGGKAYYLGRRIMKSLFGAVFHGVQGNCTNPSIPSTFRARTGNEYHVAVKRSSLAHMRHTPQENVFREVSVMRYLSAGAGHPYVMPLVDACITSSHIYVVTPFCPGGDLLKSVKPQEGTGEAKARRWFRQVLLGIGYIHSKGLCHHDLSPENVVITADGSAAVVMDMGMIQRIPMGAGGEPAPMQDAERFGKLRYMAPEIYATQEYDGRQADIWSVGATLVVCLAGEYPWEAPTRVPVPQREIFHSDIYRYTDLAEFGAEVMLNRMNLSPPRVSREAVDLICKMLVIDRGLRPNSAEILANHPFCVD